MVHEQADVGVQVDMLVDQFEQGGSLLLCPGGDLGDQQRGHRAVLIADVAPDAQRSSIRRRTAEDGKAVALLHGRHVNRPFAAIHVLVFADERMAGVLAPFRYEIATGSAFDQWWHGSAFPDVAHGGGQGGKSHPSLDDAEPLFAGQEHNVVRGGVGKHDELLFGLLRLMAETIPEQQRPHAVGRQQHPILAAIKVLLIGRDLDHHAAAVGIGIGADEDVHVVELPGRLVLGHLPFEGLDGRAGGAGVAGVGLLLAAGLVTEGRKEPVEIVQAAFGDADDVVAEKADFFQQPRHRPASRPVKRAIGNLQGLGRVAPLLLGQVFGQQETLNVVSVFAMNVHDLRVGADIIEIRHAARRHRGRSTCPWRPG